MTKEELEGRAKEEGLLLLAGRKEYPLMLAREARAAGVKRIEAIAFRGETSRRIHAVADRVHWVRLGRMKEFFDTVEAAGLRCCVLAGQIRPRNIFSVRMDRTALEMYRRLKVRTAHTVFGAVVEALEARGVTVLPGDIFMERYTAPAGVLGRRVPSEREEADIALGLRVVKETSDLEIGQTVVIREGVIVAVEALEGTDRTIRRGGRMGGRGCVVVKVPKRGHDMRFDIPVVGPRTFRVMRRAGVSCLAVEAGKTLLLEREKLIALADRFDMAFVAVNPTAEEAKE